MVKRKDGTYQEKIKLSDGKYKYFYGKTKAEVLKKLQSFKEEEERGALFREVAEEWWEKHQTKVAHSTIRGYTARYKHAVDVFGDIPIKDITANQINATVLNLVDKQYSKKVVSTQLNVLNMIFDFAVINGYIEYSPCRSVATPKGLKKKKRELPTNADLKIVEESEWLFPFFLLYTGCRRGEALALRYEDIDWNRKIIHINKAVGYKANCPYEKTPKTESGIRDVILLDKLADKLEKKKHGLIFPNPKGEIWHESMIIRKWKQWQKKNGTSVTMHQLRHGYATILFEAGLEVKDAQYLLGHSTIAMTQDIYTHIRKERQEKNASKLNAYLNGTSE